MPQVTLDGVDTYFATAGAGDPLVLLHGGMSDGSSWGQLSDLLARSHTVFLPDRRGHGRTPDTDAAFTYESMTTETIAFCEAVVGEPAHLVGWSDGANIALEVSRSRPDLVTDQVLIGANFHFSGLMLDELGLGAGPDDDEFAMLKMLFEAVAPLGNERWPTFWAKTDQLWRTGPTLRAEDLRAIATPSLILVGDDEPIHLSHTVELYESLVDAELCVIPGASHLVPLEQPRIVADAIERFIGSARPPVTLDPIRRRNH